MLTLKNHLGIWILMIMVGYVVYVLGNDHKKKNPNGTQKYPIYVPLGSMTILFGVGEVFGWVIYWFFIVP